MSTYQGFQAQPAGTIANGASHHGVDLGVIVNSVAQNAAQALPGLLMNLLSANPQIQQLARQGSLTVGGVNPQSQFGYGGINTPFGGAQQSAGVASQGVELGAIVNSVAQSAAQALPSLLMNLLSAHPQIQQLARQGGLAAGGANLQNQFGYGINAPFGGLQSAGVAPQGHEIGAIVNSVAHNAAQALPGLIANLLSAHPQIQQLARQGGLAGGVNPQSLFGYGINTPFGGGGLNIFDRTQFGGLQNAGVSPQGFDLGSIVNSVAQNAAQALPSLLMNLLSAHPQIQQLARQGSLAAGGVNLQNQFGQNQFGQNQFGQNPLGQNQFAQNPLGQNQFAQNSLGQNQFAQGQLAQGQFGLGANTQFGGAGASSQGFDLGSIAQNVAGLISPQIPAIVNSVMGQVLGSQQTVH